MDLKVFLQDSFPDAVKYLLKELNIPVNYLTDTPADPEDVIDDKYDTSNKIRSLIKAIYPLGMVDDNIFEGIKSITNNTDLKEEEGFEYEALYESI